MEGHNPEFDRLIPPLLDAAYEHSMQIALHIEPYEGRDHMTVRRDLEYVEIRSGAPMDVMCYFFAIACYHLE